VVPHGRIVPRVITCLPLRLINLYRTMVYRGRHDCAPMSSVVLYWWSVNDVFIEQQSS